MSTGTATATDPRLLRVSEAASIVEASNASPVDENGDVLIHLIRPCVGRGKGRHVYEADMLRTHAQSGHFVDWPMFIDHESPAARRAKGGLPRGIGELGGRVVEHWWDDTVPAGGGFDQGAVVARVKPVPYVRDLIAHDPKLIQASVNTHATGVVPTMRGGRRAHVVEGFDAEGSVDWVTKAGAGGKVVELMEAAAESGVVGDDELTRLMEHWPDDSLAEYVRNERPAVAETLNSADHGEEDDVKPEELREAVHTELRSDETKTIIAEAVSEAVSDGEAVKTAVSEALREVLPGAIGAAADVIQTQATGAATKAVRMGALRAKAETSVAEAKLPDGSEMPERFRREVLEAIGTPDLDDKTEGEGDAAKVTETAEAQFDAILEAELKRACELVEAARPSGSTRQRPRRTAVSGNGTGADPKGGAEPVVEADDDDEGDALEYRSQLQEAGVDFKAAYGVGKDDEEPKGKTKAKAEEPEAETATA